MKQKIVKGIKDFFNKSGFNRAVIGLSGGIDSSVCACLCVEALGKDNVIGVSMPSKFSSKHSKEDAQELAKNLDIKYISIRINRIVEEFDNATKLTGTAHENMQARVRAILLMGLANENNALVINTGNKTEAYLGYCTLYGDSIGALSPIGNYNKLDVYKIAEEINEKEELIPQKIIEKTPSAELSPGQTDENSIGAPYDILSPLVDDIVEGRDDDELEKKYSKGIIKKVKEMIRKNKFKFRYYPPSI